MSNFTKKLPAHKDIAAVYAVAVVLLYFPTINRFFWRVPSWLSSSTIGDLFNIYFYITAVNFVESLLVLLGMLSLCIVLPRAWFRDRFVSKGTLLTFLGLGFFFYLGTRMDPEMLFPWTLIKFSPLFFLLIFGFVFLLDRLVFLQKFLEGLANRLSIFLYISIPVSVLSLLIVLVRNIF